MFYRENSIEFTVELRDALQTKEKVQRKVYNLQNLVNDVFTTNGSLASIVAAIFAPFIAFWFQMSMIEKICFVKTENYKGF